VLAIVVVFSVRVCVLGVCATAGDGAEEPVPYPLLCVYCCVAVVVRSTLTPFRCTGHGDARVLKAEPTILCNREGVHGRMVSVASLSLALYGFGVPVSFAYFLWKYRKEIREDQGLREQGKGDHAITNPNVHIRRWVLLLSCWRRLLQQRPVRIVTSVDGCDCRAGASRSCMKTTRLASCTGSCCSFVASSAWQ
jgi:hypothetical protein